MKALGYNIITASPTDLYKLFEHNSRAPTLDKSLAMIPGTKNISLKYNCFCTYVTNYTILILPIDSSNQTADILTHSLNEDSYIHRRRSIIGWLLLQEDLTCWVNQSISQTRRNLYNALKPKEYIHIPLQNELLCKISERDC